MSVLKNVIFALLLGAGALANAQQVTHIRNLQGSIQIDGELTEPQWQQATQIELNYVTRPFENTAPPVSTQVSVFEDGEYLYLAFRANDPNPDAIKAYFRDRDSVWSNDLVGFKIDTFNTSRLAYQFFVNPHGVQLDATENELTGQESSAWDAIWQSAAKITEQGYQVEVELPLRALNFNESQGEKRWRMEFVRFYPRVDRLRISNLPFDRNNSCTLCQMGEVTGFAKAKQGNNLAVIPTLLLGKGRTRDLTPDAPDPDNPNPGAWEDKTHSEPGLDVKWGITPEVSLQATLNPDFSQVESDAAQLSINNTFALFFNEKRPFFLENADYFSSNYNLVYTRNIAAPDYGAKVTGRVGAHTFGVFAANDEKTTFLVPGNLGSSIASFESESRNVALRYRYDVNQGLSVGVVSTLRDADDYHNYLYALDAKYQLTSQDSVRVQLLRSQTLNPEELYKELCDNDCEQEEDYSEAALRLKTNEEYSGSGYRLNYLHDERNWFVRATRISNSDNLRADLGFVSRADRTTDVIGGAYRWFNENSWWNRFQIWGDWDIHHNDNGELIEREVQMEISVNARYESYAELGAEKRESRGQRQNRSQLSLASADRFEETQIYGFAEIRPLPQLYLNTFFRSGDRIDVVNNRLGKMFLIEPEISWAIGEHMSLDFQHTYSQLRAEGAEVFTANLTDFRMSYQFDERQFLRLILIHSNIKRNQANYLDSDVDAKHRDLGMQLLYSYKVNPLTKFFVGYSSSGYENDDVTRFKDKEQSVFLKVSYAWLN